MSEPETALEISRLLAAPRAKIWRAWSEPEILARWWCPRPWTTQVLAFDFRPGGAFHTFLRGPDGGESDNPGCFLDIVPQSRIVTTSMLTGGYRPAEPWIGITAILTLADEGEATRYTARVLHASEAESLRHKEMGFFEGWGACIAQLEEVAQAL